MKRKTSQMSKALSLGKVYNETQIPNKINTWNICSKASSGPSYAYGYKEHTSGESYHRA
jgi:hypothetical protein